MKLNKIMLFFFVALPISLVLRFMQLFFTIETNTGFYINEMKNYGPILLILILLCTFSVGFFSWQVFVKPEKPPKLNFPLSISALLLSVVVIAEMLLKNTVFSVPWQEILFKVSSVAFSLYLILFALCPIIKIKLPEITSSVTVIYLIIRMICDFTAISKLALISDNIILIFSYCAVLLFFLNYTKLYCNAQTDQSFKFLLSSGLVSVVLTFIYSIPNMMLNLISSGNYMHTSPYSLVTVLFLGIFILNFTLSYFSKKNI